MLADFAPLEDVNLVKQYQEKFKIVLIKGDGPVMESVREELKAGLKGIPGIEAVITTDNNQDATVLVMKTDREPVKSLLMMMKSGSWLEKAFCSRQSMRIKRILLLPAKSERGYFTVLFVS